MKFIIPFFAVTTLALTSCATEAEKKARAIEAGLKSQKSQLSWGRPLPGEGGGALGGVLDRR